jgi:ubiquinone/menaquinone biosynthesis C-methylase UbiE
MADLQRTFGASIPEYYDQWLGPVQFEPFAKLLAERLAADPGGDVLEIACGTGLATRYLRSRLAPSRRLVASDLSKAMLDYAQAKVALAGIEWREADATALPFRDAEFSAAVCGFGVMFVPDKAKCFAQVRRVLRKDGVFHFSVWDRLEENPLALTYARVTEALANDAAEVRFRIPWEMADAQRLRGYLSAAGFETLRIDTRRVAVEGFTPLQIATGQTRGTPRGAILEKHGIAMETAIERVAAELTRIGGHPFRSHVQAILVEARAVV